MKFHPSVTIYSKWFCIIGSRAFATRKVNSAKLEKKKKNSSGKEEEVHHESTQQTDKHSMP